jgi:ketosteroid isomerase-like protein
MNTAQAVHRWIDGWTRGWSAHDAEPIAALYAPEAVLVSHPFREPQAPRAYVRGSTGYGKRYEHAFHPVRWAAGIEIVGVSSLVTFLENTARRPDPSAALHHPRRE